MRFSMGKRKKMSDPIRDELHRLVKEIGDLIDGNIDKFIEKTTPCQLIKYGLTLGEAEAWFNNEPNFQSIRRIFTTSSNRRRLYRTYSSIFP